MSKTWTLFVEGESDQVFLSCVLEYLDIFNIDLRVIGGGVSKLPRTVPLIMSSHDAGS